MKIIRFIVFIGFFISVLPLHAQTGKWGWETHRYINEHAVDYLPSGMDFFQNKRDFLRQHAIDPDQDNNPGFYHYIDIDYYPEFFAGTLPHQWDDMIALYGLPTVESNGIIPWVIEWWTDSLSTLMSSGNWDDAWQVAAELGHYVGDSHQPLHLTLNYNGQLTGNYGIHSRYETNMINLYLSSLSLPTGNSVYWQSPVDSVFDYINYLYPYVSTIITADDNASLADPTFGSVYYSNMWQELATITTDAIQKAILDLASIWHTAWINAGSPSPTNIEQTDLVPADLILANAYPNPFNPDITIDITVKKSSKIKIEIFDITGRFVKTIHAGFIQTGNNLLKWDATNEKGKQVNTGTYFVRINIAENILILKILLLR